MTNNIIPITGRKNVKIISNDKKFRELFEKALNSYSASYSLTLKPILFKKTLMERRDLALKDIEELLDYIDKYIEERLND